MPDHLVIQDVWQDINCTPERKQFSCIALSALCYYHLCYEHIWIPIGKVLSTRAHSVLFLSFFSGRVTLVSQNTQEWFLVFPRYLQNFMCWFVLGVCVLCSWIGFCWIFVRCAHVLFALGVCVLYSCLDFWGVSVEMWHFRAEIMYVFLCSDWNIIWFWWTKSWKNSLIVFW